MTCDGIDGQWSTIGPELDTSVISDERGVGEHVSFNRAFVGMAAYDITGQGRTASFAEFTYDPT